MKLGESNGDFSGRKNPKRLVTSDFVDFLKIGYSQIWDFCHEITDNLEEKYFCHRKSFYLLRM